MKKRPKDTVTSLPPRERAESSSVSFEMRYTRDAAAEIKALDGSIRKQLRKAIDKKLSTHPDEYGTPLRGDLVGYWKHEFANHRVIYRIYLHEKIVAICAVGIRKASDERDVYHQLQAIADTGRLAGQMAEVFGALLSRKK
jgi:mRNA interferase RelE/StbE